MVYVMCANLRFVCVCVVMYLFVSLCSKCKIRAKYVRMCFVEQDENVL